jgi:hypothetical protein
VQSQTVRTTEDYLREREALKRTGPTADLSMIGSD